MTASKDRLRCLIFAVICAASLAGWQALTVHYSFGGNWTALYYTGSHARGTPRALDSEHIYIHPNSAGYDGHIYHYLAHDPLLRRGFTAFMDNPRYRGRRILVPALAWLFAFGRDEWVDSCYLMVMWASVILGAYWLGRLAVRHGYPAWIGLGFALVPSVLVSIDRLTVDIALAACTVGFALYAEEESPAALYIVLAASGLIRETGLLLPAAYCIWLATRKQFLKAAVFATSVIPTFAWFIYVDRHTAPGLGAGGYFISLALFNGLVERILHPFPYPATFKRAIVWLAIGLDLVALAGIVGALVWAARRAFERVWTPVAIALYLFALLTIVLVKGDAWSEVFAFGRTLTPLLLLAALDGMEIGSVIPAIGMLVLDPRIGLQLGGQIINVARGIFS